MYFSIFTNGSQIRGMCNITFLLCDVTVNDLLYASHHTAHRSTLYAFLVDGSKKFEDTVFFQAVLIVHIEHGGCNTIDQILMWRMSF